MSQSNRPHRRRSLTAILMTFVMLLGSLSAASAAPDQGGFWDVSDRSPHANNIYMLTESGVISGYPDGTFRPAQPVTRGQVSTMVVYGFELDAELDPGRFRDVAGTTHAANIGVLASIGVIEGYPDGTFRPGVAVTRAQAASILARVLEARPVAGTQFPDVPEGATHRGAINALHERGVITGYADGTFRPGDPVQRDQFASMLRRAMDTQGIGASLTAPARVVAREIAIMAAEGDLDGLARFALQGPVTQPRGTPGPGFTASFDEEVSTPEELVALWERIGRDEVLRNLTALVHLPDWYRTMSTDAAGEPVPIYVTPRFMHEPTEANRRVLEARLGAEAVAAGIADGQWLGWRLGITAEGDWQFFVTGD
jgi:hypothetical protein